MSKIGAVYSTKIYRWRTIIFIILLSLSNIATAFPKYIYDKAPDSYFIVHGKQFELAMKGAVLSEKRNNKTNNFCAIGLKWNSGDEKVDVFWKETTRLYYWADIKDVQLEVYGLILSKGINYETDVVDTQADIGFSSYLMVRSDVEDLLRDCEKHGQKFVIEPFKTPGKCTQFDDCKNPLGLLLRNKDD